MKPLTNETLIEKTMNRIMNQWIRVESKVYIAGVLGWINVVVREEIASVLQAKEEEMVKKIDYMLETLEPKFKTNIALYNNGFDDALHEVQIKLPTL